MTRFVARLLAARAEAAIAAAQDGPLIPGREDRQPGTPQQEGETS